MASEADTQIAELEELERQINQAMIADRHRLRRLARSIRQAQTAGKPCDRNLQKLQGQLKGSTEKFQRRAAKVPTVSYPEELPVSARREEIKTAIQENQVVVVSGETGSGKSTQLPKICLEMGRGIAGWIGHTQPRRIAARSVASRVAEELGSQVGESVGFKVRFTDSTSGQTFIKLMTDGILLAESQGDRFLDQYDTIIIDEAHERSLNIDFLIGYLKQLLPKRRDLKLIITSATIDAQRFSEHFADSRGPAPVIEVSGRTYPVEVRYRPLVEDEDGNEPDLQRGICEAVSELAELDANRGNPGDMLIFMPTEREIHDLAKVLRGWPIPGDDKTRKTEILPLYARLSANDQNRVFAGHSHRRIVIATNVAESSLTVPNIYYVIDPGTARVSRYAARSGVQRLPIEAVSQASADQRKGRCGRIGPGVCIRLFDEEDYHNRPRFTSPEIQRTNLASVILQAKVLNFGAIEEFPFLDPPRREAIKDGYRTLFELGAVDEENEITEVGKQIAKIPLDPRLARIVLAGDTENCLHEILIIAAALEIQDPRERPLEKQQAADEKHKRFLHEDSDFLSYLTMWDFYHQLRHDLSRSKLRLACRENFLSYNRLREWADIHRQLLEMVQEAGYKPRARKDDYNAIHRALLTGYLTKVGYRGDEKEYTLAGGQKAFVWPGSGLIEKKPKWVVSSEILETSRQYLRCVARIDPGWIEPLASHLVKRSYHDPHWSSQLQTVLAYEKVSLGGLVIVPRRQVKYGPIDPALARTLFIQHALVEGDWDSQAEFYLHNQQLMREMEALAAKSRRRDLLLGDQVRYEFYDERLPADVFDARTLERWRRKAERENPDLLKMTKSDLVVEQQADQITQSDFPDSIAVDQLRLPLEYHLEPGSEEDGITITVAKEGLTQLDPNRLGWLVPGLVEEKITALIKSLPKSYRRPFIPIPQTAKKVAGQLRFGEGSFAAAVAKVLGTISATTIPLEAFELEKLPNHLQMNVKVVDSKGAELAKSRDLVALRRRFGTTQAATAAGSYSAIDDPDWYRDGITAWDFEHLPESVEITRGDTTFAGYPTLIDQGDSVALRLLDSPEKAKRQTRAGIRRLCILSARKELKHQVEWFPKLDQLNLFASKLCRTGEFKDQLLELLADRAFLPTEKLPRLNGEYQKTFRMGKQRISIAVQELADLLFPMFQAYHQVKATLEKSQGTKWDYARLDMQHQLDYLFQRGFFVTTPFTWLRHYPRYIKGIQTRLDKLQAGGMSRDYQDYKLLYPRWHRFLKRAQHHRQHGLEDPELSYYRWMMEEYRVSLFAQQLGTSISVSDKRLDKQWEKVKV